MAVVQISRIQIRRGTEGQGEALPQLASGEMAWALDTQNLYIGNGAVSEGAPAVGNTRILTEADAKDIFNLADTYVYKNNNSVVQTGPTAAAPTRRSLQERLDDIVFATSFGVVADGVVDDTAALQRAIDQLFINTATKANPNSRVVLQLPAGTIKVSGTVYLPPYTSLIGAGSNKTIITTTSTDPVFRTVNGDSVAGTYAADATTTNANQASNIIVKGITITNATKGMLLISCKDSYFEDIILEGVWDPTQDPIADTTIGIDLRSVTSLVSSNDNVFSSITVKYFSYGLDSNYDITNNIVENSMFELCGMGVSFGRTTSGLTGQADGPTTNKIINNRFVDIKQHGVLVENGSYNLISGNSYKSVGNDGGALTDVLYSAVQLNDKENSVVAENFERSSLLSTDGAYLSGTPYIPEVGGQTIYDFAPIRKDIGQSNQPSKFFRLPLGESSNFKIDYIYKSTAFNAQRVGTLSITANLGNNTVQISDEYDFTGDIDAENLEFTAFLSNETGTGDNDTVSIYAKNTTLGDAGFVQFKATQLS